MELVKNLYMLKKFFINTGLIFLINSFLLLFIFIVLESAARIFYPEFKNDYHTSTITRGKKVHYLEINKNLKIRAPNSYSLKNSKEPIFLIIGDSISKGYGLDYYDTYFSKL